VIVDAHQHFWAPAAVDYPWLAGAEPILQRTYTPDDLEPELRAAGIDATVVVQAADSRADTEAMLAHAVRRPWIAGVVGWVPLADPGATARGLDGYAAHAAVRGVRHLLHDEPDPDWVVQPPVLESLGLVAARGLAFDVPAELPRHLEHVATLAGRLPHLTIVVDHLGKPPIRARGWQPWAALLAAAAEHPNVVAKLSGLNTAADRARWNAEALRPYVEHGLACFGPERLMYGSDWPVALLAGDYAKVWRATRRLVDALAPAEREQVLGGTARRVYDLVDAGGNR